MYKVIKNKWELSFHLHDYFSFIIFYFEKLERYSYNHEVYV